ncbi:MAG: pitrilysin family protein [Candidatus Margulisiibacteriota bacterium]|jgi:predicted Zn-dependent peptidase
MQQDQDFIKFDQGLRLVVKNIPHFHSVSLGIFIKTGLNDEPLDVNGISHVLEHMSFKGTKTRSAKQIADLVDTLGGNINAYTSKEYTCYYLTVLADHIDEGITLLSDIFLNSKLDEKDLALEKQVILEEINMYEDTPDENIHDLFSSTIWQNTKLGLPIIGTKETVNSISKKSLQEYKENYLDFSRVIVVVAGKVINQPRLVKKIEKLFAVENKNTNLIEQKKAIVTPKVFFKEKETEQIHLCLGFEGLAYNHADHYVLLLLNSILGETMSSRLFQELREKRGLCYSIFSYASFFEKNGLLAIYSGVSKENFKKTIDLIYKELQKLTKNAITVKEFYKAKEHLKGSLAIGLEKSSSWLGFFARMLIYYDELFTLDDVLKKINKVTLDDLNRVAYDLIKPEKFALAGVGPFSQLKLPSNINEFLF